jgi:hypothetical protein
MMRSTLYTEVQQCPSCGYCASDVSKPRPDAADVVSSGEYQIQLIDPAFPNLANLFLCRAIIDQASGDYVAATWALIKAAWACDDSDRVGPAMACRTRAADMLLRAEQHALSISAEEGAGTAILVDLLRRSGRMEDARKAIAERRSGVVAEIIRHILDYQSVLVAYSDTASHTIAEVLRFGE